MTRSEDEKRERESRRIIDRINDESETSGVAARTARRLGDHLSAADADQRDWAEVWGTRIGRTIGALVVVVLFLYLWNYLMSPA
jgi:hypothetical protein